MVKFIEIKAVNSKNFKDAIKIYTASFPPNERQSIFTIKRRVKENSCLMFIGCLDDKVVFMALLYPLKNTEFILLDYMATDKDHRDKGLAANFIEIILEKISPKYLILEVENPLYGNNKTQREKRFNFYKRLGAKELKDVRYLLPPLSGKTPTEMILMVLPKCDKGKLSGYLVKKIVTQIYKELYGRSKDDELLNSFIGDIKNSIELV